MLIECSNIKKSFQGIDLLKDISFKVDDHFTCSSLTHHHC